MARRSDHEKKATELFEDLRWLPPVATPDLLPTDDVRDGHMCFVTEENAIYEFKEGAWSVNEKAKGS